MCDWIYVHGHSLFWIFPFAHCVVLFLGGPAMLAIVLLHGVCKLSRTCRARFPADPGCLDAAAESRQLSRILAFLGGPREARGRLRRRAPYGAGRLRRRPRFARQGLASLGLAKLRKWLSSAGTNDFLCSANPCQGEAKWSTGAPWVLVKWRTEWLRTLGAQTMVSPKLYI